MNNQNFHHVGSKKGLIGFFVVILSVFFIVLTVFFVVGIQNKIKEGKYIGQDVESRSVISVNATGEVYAKPDLALIDFSVITEAKTVAEAMKTNTEKMNEVINFVKSQGVEEKDLKTTSFTIYPRYEYEKAEILIYPPSPGKRVLAGYEITQQLEVKIRDLDKIGQIIEGSTDAGANQIGDLQFTIDNQDEFKKQAREEAISEAKTKAKELADQLGVKLVRITSFSESSYAPQYGLYKSFGMEEVGGEAPEIETGENEITVSVIITYEIR